MNRKVVLAGAALVVAVAAGLGFFWPFGRRPEVLRLPGIVEIQEIHLGSKVGGRVDKLAAGPGGRSLAEGDLVEAGQPLVYLEVPELQAQREQTLAKVYEAQADLDKAKAGPRKEEKEAAKAAAEAAWARYDRVKSGWRKEEVRQAKSELDSAEADLQQATEDYERVTKLYRQRSTSQSEYEVATGARNRAQARINSARARYDMYMRGSRKEDIAEAEQEGKRAEAQYQLLKAGTREEDIAAAEARLREIRGKLREVEVNLEEGVVRAPDRAVIEVMGVRKGDLVRPGQPIVTVLRAEDLWVRVYVAETDLGKIRLGQTVEVTIDSYPGRTFQGKVIQINSRSEFTPRNVQSPDERRHQVFGVKVRVDNPEGVFKAGMAAEVVLPLQPAP